MDQKVMMDMVEKMGFSKDAVDKLKEEYMKKSDEEILQDLKGIKEAMGKDPKAYRKQMQMIKQLAMGMNEKERARLEKLIGLLQS